MQSLREQLNIIGRWEDKVLEPPDDYEPTHECCMCNHEADYEVMGDYYCESCLHAEFRI